MVQGIEPDIKLFCNETSFKRESNPIVHGNVPIKDKFIKCNLVSDTSPPIDDGILPDVEVNDKEISVTNSPLQMTPSHLHIDVLGVLDADPMQCHPNRAFDLRFREVDKSHIITSQLCISLDLVSRTARLVVSVILKFLKIKLKQATIFFILLHLSLQVAKNCEIAMYQNYLNISQLTLNQRSILSSYSKHYRKKHAL